MIKLKFPLLLLLFSLAYTSCNQLETGIKPNIIIVYMDDLGYGDVSYNGATKLQTPNMDAMAMAGMRFNNGYATSATCTPSRYALLTGVYPWREKRAKILRYGPINYWSATNDNPKNAQTTGLSDSNHW